MAEHSQNTEKESETTVTVCFLTKWHTCILLATNVDKRIWPEWMQNMHIHIKKLALLWAMENIMQFIFLT